MKDSKPILRVGEIVQVWDALYDEELNDIFNDFLVPHHGKIGIIIGVAELAQDFHSVNVGGEIELYHTDNLRRAPGDA